MSGFPEGNGSCNGSWVSGDLAGKGTGSVRVIMVSSNRSLEEALSPFLTLVTQDFVVIVCEEEGADVVEFAVDVATDCEDDGWDRYEGRMVGSRLARFAGFRARLSLLGSGDVVVRVKEQGALGLGWAMIHSLRNERMPWIGMMSFSASSRLGNQKVGAQQAPKIDISRHHLSYGLVCRGRTRLRG